MLNQEGACAEVLAAGTRPEAPRLGGPVHSAQPLPPVWPRCRASLFRIPPGLRSAPLCLATG